jgi:hypothetical protein
MKTKTNKKRIAEVVEEEFAKCRNDFDNNRMSHVSANWIRQRLVEEKVFKTDQHAFFWFTQNEQGYKWVCRLRKQLMRKYDIPDAVC